MDGCCNNKRCQTPKYIGDYPLWDKDYLPDDMVVLGNAYADNASEYDPFLTTYLVPARTFQSKSKAETTIDGGGFDISQVPENQVRAGYIYSNATDLTQVRLSDTDNPVMFLITGTNRIKQGYIMIQNSGFIRFPAGHNYIVGQSYYLSDKGVPTTTTGTMHLFDVVDRYTLSVRIGG